VRGLAGNTERLQVLAIVGIRRGVGNIGDCLGACPIGMFAITVLVAVSIAASASAFSSPT
jgi:hypothetical protein